MNIGICTPYRNSDTTAAALRLADLAVSLSLNVKLLGVGKIAQNVHPYWDGKVRPVKRSNVYNWASGCDALIWFDHQSMLLHQSKLVAEKALQYLVPSWHTLPGGDIDHGWQYSKIICPCKAAVPVFREQQALLGKAEVTYCAWDSGITPIKRTDTGNEKTVRLYVPMDADTVDANGPFVLHVIPEILQCMPHVNITLECGKSWPKCERKTLKQLTTRWKAFNRLTIRPSTSFVDQLSAMHEHDLVYLPALRSNFGSVATRALACHTPVIAYDVEPFSSLLKHGSTGLLIPCEICPNWAGAPIAFAGLAATLNTLHSAMYNPQLLHDFQRRDWKLTAAANKFSTFWRNLWHVA